MKIIKLISTCFLINLSLLNIGQAKDYPQRPITFVVPYAPGGPADLIAREVANTMSKLNDITVIVENKPGAGANLGGSYVARAKKDGYTLLFGSSPVLVINPSMYKNLDFNPLQDYYPVSEYGSLPNAVLVTNKYSINNINELIALGKKNEELSYASAGVGGTTHLAGVLFGLETDLNLMHVPYNGSNPALQALLSDHVALTFTDVFTALPFIKSDKLKILGVTSEERSDLFPDVPTLQEQGMKDIDISVFFALLAPKDIPDDVKEKLNKYSKKTLNDDTLQKKLKQRGLILSGDSSSEFLKNKLERETKQWAEVIKKAKIEAN